MANQSIGPVIFDSVTALHMCTYFPLQIQSCSYTFFSVTAPLSHVNLQPWMSNASFLMSIGFGVEVSLLFTKSTLVLWSKSPSPGNSRGNNSKKSSKYMAYSRKPHLVPRLCGAFTFPVVVSSSSI